MARKDVSKLREEAAKAIERGKLDRAIELYEELEAAEPAAPTWPKRIGETHRRNGNNSKAVAAFERAAEKYVIEGFLVQAIAVCKMILQIDPNHSTTQARLTELMRPRPRSTTKAPANAATPPSVPAVTLKPEPQLRPPEPTRPAEPERPAAPKGIDRTPVVKRAPEPPRPSAVPPKAPEPAPRAIAIPPKPVRAPTAEPAKPAPPAKHAPTAPIARPRVPAPPPPPFQPPSEQRLPRPVRRAPKPSLPAIIVDRAPVELSRIEIPPGSGLDAIDFSTLIPGSQPLLRDDGTLSGVNVLLLGDEHDAEHDAEHEAEHEAEHDVELSLDDAEISTLDSDTARVPGPAARHALLTTPLFPAVPPHVLETLIARMSLLELVENEVLFREGDTGHELFVISEGEVAVESAAAGELARLGPGAFFGEIALVTDLPRSATIRAITRVELLAIDREVLRDALAEHPEILTVMLRFVRDRLIDRITRTSELFQPFTELERMDLSGKFELVEVVPDAVLITQGERADGLYLVVAGKVEVRRTGEGVLATLGSGDVFGELSLLTGGGSRANVRSVTRVLALRMPASTFQEVIMTHPQVLMYLSDLAERRAPHAEAEDFIDLHLDMLV